MRIPHESRRYLLLAIIVASSPSCFLEGVFPKGNGSLTQAVTGTLQKIDKLFGGDNELLTAQRGALALGTSLIMATDQALALQKVSQDDRQKISASASKQLSETIGSLSTASLGLALDPGALQLLIAKTAAGSVNKGAMMASVAIAKDAAENGAPRDTKDVANWVGWAAGAITEGVGGAVSVMSAAQKAALMKAQATETLKASGDLGDAGVALVAGSMAKHMIKNLQNGPGKGADAATMQAMVGGAVGGAIAGTPSTVTGAALGNVLLVATQNAAVALKGVGTDSDRVKFFGEIGGSAIKAAGEDLKIGKSDFTAIASKAVSGPMMELNNIVSDIGAAKGAVAALTGPACKQAAKYVDAKKLGDMAGQMTAAAVSGMGQVAKSFDVSAATVMSSGLISGASSGAMAGLMTADGIKVANIIGQLDDMTRLTAASLDDGGFTGSAGGAMKSMMSGMTLGMAGVMSSAQMSTGMVSLCKGATQGAKDLLRSGVDMSTLTTAIVAGSAGSADNAGISDSTRMKELMLNIMKGTSMGAADLETEGLFSASALSSSLAAANMAGLGAMKEMTSLFTTADVGGYADDLYGAIRNGAAMSGLANADVWAAMKTAMNNASGDLGITFDTSGVAFATADTNAAALQSAISSGTVTNCYPTFSDDKNDTDLAASFTAALAANPSGDTTSFICRNNIGLCPAFRPAVAELGGSDVFFAAMGNFCEGHKLAPFVQEVLTLCSKVTQPAMKADVDAIYDPAFNQLRCGKDTAGCPTIDASVTHGGTVNWLTISQNFGGVDTEVCALNKPASGGNGNSTLAGCPATFTINADSIYKTTASGGFASGFGVGCMREPAGTCPTLSQAGLPASVKFVPWSFNMGPFRPGNSEDPSGNSCMLVGDYDKVVESVNVGLVTGTAVYHFTAGSTTNVTATPGVWSGSIYAINGAYTYECFYDQRIDGIVHASYSGDSAPCSSDMVTRLGGTGYTFNSSNGVITWTPPNHPGEYEIKLVAKNASGARGAMLIQIVVHPAVNTSSLFASWDAMTADLNTSAPFDQKGPLSAKTQSSWYPIDPAVLINPPSNVPFFTSTFSLTPATILNMTVASNVYGGWTGNVEPWQFSGSAYTYALGISNSASPMVANFGSVLTDGAIAASSESFMVDGMFQFQGGKGGGMGAYSWIMGNWDSLAHKGFKLGIRPQAGNNDFDTRLEYILGGWDSYPETILTNYNRTTLGLYAYYRFDRFVQIPGSTNKYVPNEVGALDNTMNLWGQVSASAPPYNFQQGGLTRSNDRSVSTSDSTGNIDFGPNSAQFCPSTWEMWVKNSGVGASAYSLIDNMQGTYYGWQIRVVPGDFAEVRWGTNGTLPGEAYWVSSLAVTPDTLWHHIAITCVINGPNYEFRYYKDGVQQGSPGSVSNSPAISFAGSQHLKVYNVNSLVFVDDVSLYTTQLSTADIAGHYARSTTPFIVSQNIGSNWAWHHIGIASQTTTPGYADLYIDGSNQSSSTSISGANLWANPLTNNATNTKPLQVGCVPTMSNCWSGAIGDLRVYNAYNPASVFPGNFTATKFRYYPLPYTIDPTNQVKAWISSSNAWSPANTPFSGDGPLEFWGSMDGSNGFMQPGAGFRPTRASNVVRQGPDFNGAAVHFDGTQNQAMSGPAPNSMHLTYLITAAFKGTQNNAEAPGIIFDEYQAAIQGWSMKRLGDGTLEVYNNGTLKGSAPQALLRRDKPYLISFSHNSGGGTLRVDGTPHTVTFGSNNPGTVYVGADHTLANGVTMDLIDFLSYPWDITGLPALEMYFTERLNLNMYP